MLDWPDNLAYLHLPIDADNVCIDTVALHVSRVLNSGTLALFIGSGVSRVVNLPIWKELNSGIIRAAPTVLKECFPGLWSDALEAELPTLQDMQAEKADPLAILDSVEEVCSRCETLAQDGEANKAKFVGDAPSWHLVVRRALYGTRKKYGFEEMFDPELVSLCSLLTGGHRGLIREIVTFNYDDLLQSYLKLHGHQCHTVTPLPNQLTPNYGATFYHPHGYLPLQDDTCRDSSFVVLSKRSYDQVSSGLRPGAKLWRDFIAWILCVRVGLFVGISGNDRILGLHFDEALKLIGPSQDRRPLAFAVLLGKGCLSPSDWLEKRVVPLEFSNTTSVAKFLALVCQHAADLAKNSRT